MFQANKNKHLHNNTIFKNIFQPPNQGSMSFLGGAIFVADLVESADNRNSPVALRTWDC